MSNKLTLAKFMLDITLNPKSVTRTHTLHTLEFKFITPDSLLAAARFNSCFFLSECAYIFRTNVNLDTYIMAKMCKATEKLIATRHILSLN